MNTFLLRIFLWILPDLLLFPNTYWATNNGNALAWFAPWNPKATWIVLASVKFLTYPPKYETDYLFDDLFGSWVKNIF
jgi:hypothetical protein